MNVKFSVLLSVYYKETSKNLICCLDSMLEEQTVIPSEIVLVCDGPLTDELDNTILEYCQKYPNIMKVYRLPKNVGLGSALNFGLEKCSYSLVARMDSDDICHPKRFEIQLNYLKNNPNVAILGSGIAEFIDNPSNIISTKVLPKNNDDIYEFAKFRNPMSHVTVMFYKDIVLKNGSYLPLFFLEDYYLWVRLINQKVIFANIDDVLVYVRVDNGMINRRSDRKYISGWFFLNKYMWKNNFISLPLLFRNMLSIIGFIYMPKFIKKLVYKYFLRG